MSSLTTQSTSSSSGLGNTSLKGFGGLASGLDRDALIEQLTSGTNNKITKAKQDIQTIEWKQEAYQSITDKVIDLEDNYLSLTGSKSIVDPSFYSNNVVTAKGDDSATKFISAKGASSMTSYLAIQGVTQLASSATVRSNVKASSVGLETQLSLKGSVTTSDLKGKFLQFGTLTISSGGNKEFTNLTSASSGKFTFKDSFTDSNGNKVNIDYVNDSKEVLASKLTELAKAEYSDLELSFSYDSSSDSISMSTTKSDIYVKGSSTALDALGKSTSESYVSFDSVSSGLQPQTTTQSAVDFLKSNSLTITYGNTTKSLTLLSDSDGITQDSSLDDILSAINNNLSKNENFGSGFVKATASADGKLLLGAASSDDTTTVTLTSSDSSVLNALGVKANASNKLTTSASIADNATALGLAGEDNLDEKLANLTINGKQIEGVTSSTTIDELLSKINKSDAGVKATYLSSSGSFLLVNKDTGAGKTIDLGGSDSIASKLFGGTYTEGKNAKMTVSYGGSISEEVTSDTNTFKLDGLELTVSGTFGQNTNGNFDSSKSVTFSSAADTDKIVERIKSFVEDYNKILDEVRTNVTTAHNRDYTPLTKEQEDEMSEKEIEKWNTEAKKGLLYGDSTLRDFDTALSSLPSKYLQSGISYADMEKIGITFSSDYTTGGKLILDETKLKAALESEPETVSDVMAGNDKHKGLGSIMNTTLTPYATHFSSRNGGSYGRLVEEAGSNRLVLSKNKNQAYKQIQEKNKLLDSLKDKLKIEQDRYIKQFSNLETLINKMNTQSMYLSGLTG